VPKVKSEGPGRNAPATRGRWLRETWDSTIGKKVIVAITGAILLAYVVLHVLGNLKAFQGDGSSGAAVDDYAHFLRTVGSPLVPRDGLLWLVRIILIVALVIHIAAITSLARRNRAARPAGHAAPVVQRSLSSRTMALTGILILAFVVFHILQFTTRTIQITPVYEGTVYANLDAAFSKWYFVVLYVGAVILLGMHLKHAIWSVTQTAGWDKPNRNPTFRRIATGTAIAITVGFAAVPICFYTNVLPDPPSTPQIAQIK
jgi:succinate dehydrogenase / fumarate reductase, cytochrome b subunit